MLKNNVWNKWNSNKKKSFEENAWKQETVCHLCENSKNWHPTPEKLKLKSISGVTLNAICVRVQCVTTRPSVVLLYNGVVALNTKKYTYNMYTFKSSQIIVGIICFFKTYSNCWEQCIFAFKYGKKLARNYNNCFENNTPTVTCSFFMIIVIYCNIYHHNYVYRVNVIHPV